MGLGTADHVEPFQFSISVPDGLPSPFTPRTAPTAQQSEPVTHEMSKSPPPWPAGTGGVAARVHVVPFHVSTRGAKVLPEPDPMFSMETPAAQHWVALAHDDPSRTSSAPVPGVVATYQPDVAAPLPTWATIPTTPITIASNDAARASRPALGDRSRARSER